MNDYYVYEWIRLDTNEPFYVGKGKGRRWRKLTRGNNYHFNNIVKTIPVAVNILHDCLEEEVANELEVWYIREYRDIIGYDLCNIADGGEGLALCGESNPFYGKKHTEKWKQDRSKENKGRDPRSSMTKEQISEMSKKQSKAVSGENNPMYGKGYLISGENNPNYGKSRSEETKRKISESRKGKYTGKRNPHAKSVICLTTKRIFYTATEAGNYYNVSASFISNCCKGYKMRNGKKERIKSAGKLPDGTPLVWRKLIWNHDKKFRINN